MGIELTSAQLLMLLTGLRAALIVQTAIGCLLCVLGIQTAWVDLKWATIGNGGRQIASTMRLQVEILLLFAFVLNLVLALFYMVPLDQLIDSAVLIGPVAKGRLLFNTQTFLLLLVKVVLYRGRRKLDRYYDEMAAADVLRQKGLYSHKRTTDDDPHSDTQGRRSGDAR